VRIGELAQQTGSTTKTIRYYEQIGVMPQPERTASGYRDYNPDAVHQLKFIQSAQAAGLTLSEIHTIVAIGTTGSSTCKHVEDLVENKIVDVDKRMTALQRTRAELTRVLEDARSLQPAQCGDGTVCHILYDPNRT